MLLELTLNLQKYRNYFLQCAGFFLKLHIFSNFILRGFWLDLHKAEKFYKKIF